MFSHIVIGSNDIERSKTFYDATFKVLGAGPGMIDPYGRIFYMQDGGVLMVTKPINGEAACPANGATVAFKAGSPELVEAWQKAGVETGGEIIEDPAGWRETAMFKLYIAYLRDPDGNKICAVYRDGA